MMLAYPTATLVSLYVFGTSTRLKLPISIMTVMLGINRRRWPMGHSSRALYLLTRALKWQANNPEHARDKTSP